MNAPAAPMGRRARRKAEAKRRLLSAARQAIAQSGIVGVRISDVTALADLGFGTFYSYFESKEALVDAVAEEVLSGLGATIGGAALEFEDPAEAASASYRRFLRFGRDQPEFAKIIVELDRANDMFEDVVRPWARETLERGQRLGRFDIPNVELCLTSVAASALAVISGILSGHIAAGPDTESSGAEMMLRAFGVDRAAAHRIAYRELPALGSMGSDGPAGEPRGN
ncbi:TetR/AcrR family transcriptional regulator [Mycobacterium sp. pUA109]|uniref:TetR/AcrR family transcriptional regulator n=1 Tax=Mycobacterium sp. pUA109 TaxID=3238982 RepID=UPI00351B4B05